jgi:pimeloyl-ACP methyl ester carboxylesterase
MTGTDGQTRRGGIERCAAMLLLLLIAAAYPIRANGDVHTSTVAADGERDLVVLVHGLGRTKLSMLSLEWALEEAGYDVLNWGYSSVTLRMPELGAELAERVRQELAATPGRRVHWVGHSMGGILIRWALVNHPKLRGGRVVMLAPPNQGSASADRYANAFGWLLRPLPDLRTDSASAVRRLGSAGGVEIGVIAGASDGKVSVAETRLPGAADHIVIPGWHTFLMAQPAVQRQVVQFLQNGRFARPITATDPTPLPRRGGA